jgi:Uri superfamily endonuclease
MHCGSGRHSFIPVIGKMIHRFIENLSEVSDEASDRQKSKIIQNRIRINTHNNNASHPTDFMNDSVERKRTNAGGNIMAQNSENSSKNKMPNSKNGMTNYGSSDCNNSTNKTSNARNANTNKASNAKSSMENRYSGEDCR